MSSATLQLTIVIIGNFSLGALAFFSGGYALEHCRCEHVYPTEYALYWFTARVGALDMLAAALLSSAYWLWRAFRAAEGGTL